MVELFKDMFLRLIIFYDVFLVRQKLDVIEFIDKLV